MAEKRKVLVIGLDGMTFTSLDAMVEAGVMPVMKGLLEEGAAGTLMSVIPPVTGPAWATFFTGRNPGSHGILDFFTVTRDGRSRRLINSREVAGKTLWNLLAAEKRTAVVVNTPMTYPPTPIEGAMITGMLTPNADSGMTWPEDLYRRLKPELGEYVITVNWQEYSPATAARFLKDLLYCNAQRTKWILRLMEEYDPDFTMAVFTGTDRVHHALWHYVDPAERSRLGDGFDAAIMEGIHEYFGQLDGNIGRIVDRAGPEAAVFFVSDHGFGPLRRKVYINNWLEREGLLKIRHGRLKAYQAATLAVRLANKVFKRLRPGRLLGGLRPKAKQRAALASFAFYHVFYDSIDWSRTKVYMASNSEQGVYVNLKGREPFGIVDPADYDAVRDEAEAALRRLTDESGKPLLSRCYRREDLYSGPWVGRAPDVVFFLEEGAYLAEIQLGRKIFREIAWRTGTGNHRLEGFFLARGPGIRPIPRFETNLIDVMPTLLHSLGMAIPQDLDGRLIEEIFTPEFLEANRPVYRGTSLEGEGGWGAGEDVFDEKEEADLEERMRSLGYMD